MEGLTLTGFVVAMAVVLVVLVAQYVANVTDYIDPSAAF